jgi:hypothetical protein
MKLVVEDLGQPVEKGFVEEGGLDFGSKHPIGFDWAMCERQRRSMMVMSQNEEILHTRR